MRISRLLSGITCCGCLVLVACGGGDDEDAPPVGGTGTAGAGGGKAGAGGKASGGSSGKAGTAGTSGGGAAGKGTGGATAGTGGGGGAKAGSGGSGGAKAGNGGTAGTAGIGGAGASGKGGAGGAVAGSGGAGGPGAGSGGAAAGSGGAGAAGAGAAGAGAGGAGAGSGGAGAGAGNGGAGGSGPCAGKLDGASCDDGDACTTADTCSGGACVPGAPKSCAAQDQCHDDGTCDPATGLCSTPEKANGASCSDGDACTKTDTCQAGACVGANPVVCPAAQVCHTPGVCDPSTGVCAPPMVAPNLTPCDDGDACSVNDYCIAGSCFAGAAKACPWTDPCHSGSCNPSNGACEAVAVPNGDPCVDGDVCSTGDTCTAGVCDGATKCGAPGSATVVISEVRTRLGSDNSDEFVELYNTTSAAIDISGWKLNGSNNGNSVSTRATVPAGKSIPAHGHYLFAHTQYSGSVAPDQPRYTTGISNDGGVAIVDASNNIVDRVGFGASATYREGTHLPALVSADMVCYERLPGSGHGSPIDTNNNVVDFFKNTACDPQNSASEPTPAFSNAPAVLFFAGQGAAAVQASATISNTLTGPLTLQSATLSGANAAEFSFVFASALPQTLAAAGTLAVTVTHTPTASGRRFATLLVTTGAGETRAIELMAGDVP